MRRRGATPRHWLAWSSATPLALAWPYPTGVTRCPIVVLVFAQMGLNADAAPPRALYEAFPAAVGDVAALVLFLAEDSSTLRCAVRSS